MIHLPLSEKSEACPVPVWVTITPCVANLLVRNYRAFDHGKSASIIAMFS